MKARRGERRPCGEGLSKGRRVVSKTGTPKLPTHGTCISAIIPTPNLGQVMIVVESAHSSSS
jgi:hypothetical protein